VAEHNAGSYDGWTAKRRPVSLVFAQEFETIADALAAERKLKGWGRAKKEALICGDCEALPALSRRGAHVWRF
jgi:putative endonuclease